MKIKRLKRILYIVLGVSAGLPALIYLMLNLPFVQRRIVDYATEQLQKKLQTEVSIKSMGIDFPLGVSFNDIYLADRKKDSLLFASCVSAGLDLLPMLHGNLVFSSVQLSDFKLYIKRDHPKDILNLQFVIDAFKKENPDKKPSRFDLRFNSVYLDGGRVTYDVTSESKTPGRFNAAHIDVGNLSGIASVKKISNDSLNIDLRKFACKEKSGLTIKELNFKMIANSDSIKLNQLFMNMPNTTLKSECMTVDFHAAEDSSGTMKNAMFNIELSPSEITLKDFSSFVPAFQNFTWKLALSSRFRGTFNDFSMEYLSLQSGNDLQLKADMHVKDITHADSAFFDGKVSQLYVSSGKLADIVGGFSNGNVPSPLLRLGNIRFNGEVVGFLNNLTASGDFATSLGNFSTDLKIGQNHGWRTFKGGIKTDKFHLGTLLNNEQTAGDIAFAFDVDVKTKSNTLPSGLLKGVISEVTVKNYTYRNIELDGNFSTTAFNGKISLNDPNG
ncbi:MAG: AsmA family protein, partial [Bacteroidales bacterium]|nr:AsmA family protein [Bacteroidales bacterium]